MRRWPESPRDSARPRDQRAGQGRRVAKLGPVAPGGEAGTKRRRPRGASERQQAGAQKAQGQRQGDEKHVDEAGHRGRLRLSRFPPAPRGRSEPGSSRGAARVAMGSAQSMRRAVRLPAVGATGGLGVRASLVRKVAGGRWNRCEGGLTGREVRRAAGSWTAAPVRSA
jgi:hypothetical protein